MIFVFGVIITYPLGSILEMIYSSLVPNTSITVLWFRDSGLSNNFVWKYSVGSSLKRTSFNGESVTDFAGMTFVFEIVMVSPIDAPIADLVEPSRRTISLSESAEIPLSTLTTADDFPFISITSPETKDNFFMTSDGILATPLSMSSWIDSAISSSI